MDDSGCDNHHDCIPVYLYSHGMVFHAA
jgi:hypothetical protein